MVPDYQSWIERERDRVHKEFFHFLRYPTVGVDPSCKEEMKRCAEWLVRELNISGLEAELIATPFDPIVFAEGGEEGGPTLLIYGHYDVQPVDPLNEWQTPPFDPQVRNGRVYARGALDDKGQVFYALQGIRMLKELTGRIPLRVKVLIEGGEESGSAGLLWALPQLRDRLSADGLLVVDFDLLNETTPAISLGARGIVTMEVNLVGSNIDLHSGMHGGLAYNPNRALVELLATLWDKEGKVAIPGFYDDVATLTSEDQKQLTFRFQEADYARQFGIQRMGGEKGRSLLERNWLRPTLEINGISGGYAGPGFKTVIPAKATAKISCRLVPDQDPETIGKIVSDYLQKSVPEGMKLSVQLDHGGRPFRGSPDSPLAQAVAVAYHEVMGVPAHRILSGGSIPVVADLLRYSDGDVVGMGYGLAEDNIHAPNECFGLDRLEKGIETIARTLSHLAETTCRP